MLAPSMHEILQCTALSEVSVLHRQIHLHGWYYGNRYHLVNYKKTTIIIIIQILSHPIMPGYLKTDHASTLCLIWYFIFMNTIHARIISISYLGIIDHIYLGSTLSVLLSTNHRPTIKHVNKILLLQFQVYFCLPLLFPCA